MYLTRVKLDLAKRETLIALASPQILHSAIENSYKGERQRRLWRIDCVNDEHYLLILSPSEPDFSAFFKRFAKNEESGMMTKFYDPLLNRIENSQTWYFRLRANPVHSVAGDLNGSSRGKVVAHVSVQHQKQWLIKRAESCGFLINEELFDIVHTQWLKFERGINAQASILAVSFEGLLTVTDKEMFKRTLVSGIGRAKAFGCGLLTIVR